MDEAISEYVTMLLFLPYVGEEEEGGGGEEGEEEEKRRVRCPCIGVRETVTMTGKMGATSRGTDHCPPGGGR